jgi:hypothetical protein
MLNFATDMPLLLASLKPANFKAWATKEKLRKFVRKRKSFAVSAFA